MAKYKKGRYPKGLRNFYGEGVVPNERIIVTFDLNTIEPRGIYNNKIVSPVGIYPQPEHGTAWLCEVTNNIWRTGFYVRPIQKLP